MNGRASELVKSPSTALEVVALGGRDAIAQGVPEISRYSAVENSRTKRSMRSRSSEAAASVKVIATISFGGTAAAIRRATRPAMSAVLPLPAPASTRRVRSCSVNALRRAVASGSGAVEGAFGISGFSPQGHDKSKFPSDQRSHCLEIALRGTARQRQGKFIPALIGGRARQRLPGDEVCGGCQQKFCQLVKRCFRLIERQNASVRSRIKETRLDLRVDRDERFDRVRVQAALELATTFELRWFSKLARLVVRNTRAAEVASQI